jgi:hypothetical protein
MPIISLTQGKGTIVDIEDYVRFSPFKWTAHFNGRRWNVLRAVQSKNVTTFRYLPREILGVDKDVYVDHVNGNTLDNRRANLRECNKSQNGRNRGIHANNTSGFRGVSLDKRRNLFGANIRLDNGVNKFLGYFSDPKDASQAYELAAKEAFKEFYRPL